MCGMSESRNKFGINNIFFFFFWKTVLVIVLQKKNKMSENHTILISNRSYQFQNLANYCHFAKSFLEKIDWYIVKPWISSSQDRTETTLAAMAVNHFKVKDDHCLSSSTGPMSSFQRYDCVMLMFLVNVLANVKEPVFPRINGVLTHCSWRCSYP